MFESYVTTQALPVIESLIEATRKSYLILIHEKTGDNTRNHTEGSRWLGTPLELNLELFGNFHV
jgi:aromatic ring-cleaving dioxygenase